MLGPKHNQSNVDLELLGKMWKPDKTWDKNRLDKSLFIVANPLEKEKKNKK